ncbi:hypothetical protein PCE30_004848 [Citrobacter freundii]|nr:hypothetical protein [Citrobacter freundii]EKW9291938.1 hypothetical protein [Citrobacter freundii]
MRLSLVASVFTLYLISLSSSVNAENNIFDMPINIPGSKYIDAAHPTMSEWGSHCDSARNDIKEKGAWGFCNGYLAAVIQYDFFKRQKKCPNFSVGDFVQFATEESIEYRNKNAKPSTSPSTGKVIPNGGGKREPQKIPPFRIVEFFGGVVRGMTTRQRLPHLSEALWRDAETPGNSATPVPGPQ